MKSQPINYLMVVDRHSKLRCTPKLLPVLKLEYDRHRLTRDGINIKNNIAKLLVNILEFNAAKRRAGSPEIEE
jgi:hypothetical protein